MMAIDPRLIAGSPEKRRAQQLAGLERRVGTIERSPRHAGGAVGPEGPAGPEGPEGPEGSVGPEGPAGKEGPEGKTGPEGKEGKEGPAGAASMNGFKEPCRAATTANVTISSALNAGDTIDGVVLAENDRVLVKNQTTKKENGIWVVKAVPVRATDADAAGELRGGTTVYVEQGTVNGDRLFSITTNGSITPGTTEHDWAPTAPKTAAGETTATFEATKDFSKTVTITHNLGVVPRMVHIVAVTSAGSGTVLSPKLVSGSLTTTQAQFYLSADTTFGAETPITVLWEAIG